LAIHSDRRNGVARVVLRGELDLETAPSLEEHLSVLDGDGARTILIDLRDLTFIDSTGLRVLLRAFSRTEDDGHRTAIVGASESVRKLFQITGTERILDEPEGLRLMDRFTQDSLRRPRPAPEQVGLDRG
jgi:anti-anti-sigma factor